VFNTYTEEFRKNAVAVVRSGYGIANLAKRLHVPPSSIRNWMEHPRYSDVPPATDELLAMLPKENQTQSLMVKVEDRGIFTNQNSLPVMKIRIGNAEIETPENISAGSFRLLIQALRDSHVL